MTHANRISNNEITAAFKLNFFFLESQTNKIRKLIQTNVSQVTSVMLKGLSATRA